jgi:hypothetical protein
MRFRLRLRGMGAFHNFTQAWGREAISGRRHNGRAPRSIGRIVHDVKSIADARPRARGLDRGRPHGAAHRFAHRFEVITWMLQAPTRAQAVCWCQAGSARITP